VTVQHGKSRSPERSQTESSHTEGEVRSPDGSDDAQQGLPVVGIGASGGGLEAFKQFFTQMPSTPGMAFVLVQHLAPNHKSLMADLLQKHTAMPVVQAEDAMRVEPDHVYLIPPHTALTIHRRVLRLSPPEARRGYRVPIDTFLRSLAQDQGEHAIAVILSGTGGDGSLGVKAIKECNGMTMVQADAQYDGMPQSAVATGLVDFVLPIAKMPAKLIEYVRHGSRLVESTGPAGLEAEAADHLEDVFRLLRTHSGHDFSLYKQKMIVRRMQRRMQMHALDAMQQYVSRLHQDTAEIEALFTELLIGVTHFFRDPDAFEALTTQAIPKIFEHKRRDDRIRVWVSGCATGEEAYSLAMVLSEHMSRTHRRLPVQIFATDLDTRALEVARAGVYPESIAADVSPERLRQFFTRQDHSYQINQDIRDMCIFSEHNLIKAPPFSKLDLLSCRNVLIYFQAQLQQKLLPLFHYALRPGGYLFLGPSESILGASNLFAEVHKQARLFRRQDVMTRPALEFPSLQRTASAVGPAATPHRPLSGGEAGIANLADRIVLDHHAPAYVVINDKSDVVYASSRTGRYLELPSGEPNVNVINMARSDLRLALRAAIHQASAERRVVVRDHIPLYVDGDARWIRLVVRPMLEAGPDAGMLLVLFEELDAVAAHDRVAIPDAAEPIVQQLENELRLTKENLQATVEALETSNEELKSSNEELMSMNEEFQSANEELETSKEELQSINEELATVNTDLKHKIEELARANNDIKNYLDSTQIATIFLDRALCVKNFTPAISDIFRLLPSDLGRPLTDIAPQIAYDDLVQDVESVLSTLAPIERHLQTAEGEWYILRMLPYRTVDDLNDGVVMTFVNIGALKQAEEEIRRLNRALQGRVMELETLLELIPTGIAISTDPDSRHIRVNHRGYAILGLPVGSNVSKSILDGEAQYRVLLDGHEVPPDALPMQRASILGETVRNQEFLIERADGSRVNVLMSASPLYDDGGEVEGAIGAFVDITTRKRAQQEAAVRARQQSVIAELGLRALAESDLQAVMDEVAGRVAATLDVEYCKIMRLLPDGSTLRLQAGVGWRAGLVGQATVPAAGNSQAAFTLRANQPVVVADFREETRFGAPPLLAEHGVISGMSVIIHGDGQPYGVLGAHTTKPRRFTSDDINFLQSIANILTSALHRERLQEEAVRVQLQRKERLASIGILAAGIAHEMNNPLNVILMDTEYVASLLDSQTADTDEMATHLQDILHEAQRCGNIVRNLLRFAREEPTQKAPHDLNEIVERAVSLVAHYLSTDQVTVQCHLAGDLPRVALNPTEIEQVIANLLRNAMAAAGTEVVVHIRTEARPEGVQLIVQDNGPGIPEDRLPHIFDPFYSTQRHRGGTGLGLSIVHAIVRDHAGTINVTSMLGRGTTFVITLPPALGDAQHHEEDSRC
jgi:two-component system CheB/CheR fusion protein